MQLLVYTTLIWAFSFSFIGEFLAGRIDSYFAILVRVVLACLVFLPFTKFSGIKNLLKLQIMALGAVQIGIMYLFYYNSFLFISVPEVVLFTIFTPLWVTLIYDFLNKRFRSLYLVSAAVAVLGALVIKYTQINSNFILGFLMVQGANFSFALGQVGYKKLMELNPNLNQKEIFGYFHFGSLFIAILAFVFLGNFEKITPNLTQTAVLIWLGIVASGAGYFLWNKGASKVDSGVLAIMNNALVPAALIVNLIIWQKPIEPISFSIGSLLIFGSLYLHQFFEKHYKSLELKKSI